MRKRFHNQGYGKLLLTACFLLSASAGGLQLFASRLVQETVWKFRSKKA